MEADLIDNCPHCGTAIPAGPQFCGVDKCVKPISRFVVVKRAAKLVRKIHNPYSVWENGKVVKAGPTIQQSCKRAINMIQQENQPYHG